MDLDLSTQPNEVTLPIVQIVALFEETIDKQTKRYIQGQQFLRGGETPLHSKDENCDQPTQPVKRKRGRPPKKKPSEESFQNDADLGKCASS